MGENSRRFLVQGFGLGFRAKKYTQQVRYCNFLVEVQAGYDAMPDCFL